MSRARSSTSASTTNDPHPVSLKVLRLSRPTLATQTPLPAPDHSETPSLAATASLAYPSAAADPGAEEAGHGASATFPLTPLLTLPAAFGAAYVGEVFACALCVNEERRSLLGFGVRAEGQRDGGVGGVRVEARLQTPGGDREGVELELAGAEDGDGGGGGIVEEEGQRTIQRIVQRELKEEGTHVLAVTVTYTDYGTAGEGGEGRVRSFRKLYQFVAQQLVAVRSKITAVKARAPEEAEGRRRWVLEAQMQNVGESSVVLEGGWLEEREGVVGKGLNDHDSGEGGGVRKAATVLKPQDIEQVMWLLEEKERKGEDGVRVPLARLNLEWRGAMAEKGSLTTGWLASRGR